MKQDHNRWIIIDLIRGLAVLLMIIFHFSYDLKLFGHVKIDFQNDLEWWVFPRIIVFLFLFAMGLAMPITNNKPNFRNLFLKRLGKISTLALIISLGTYFIFPKRWIYFGTLHCIAVCSILAVPFLKRPIISLTVSILMLLPVFIFKFTYPWFSMEHQSMDYIPAIPWIAIVLLGIFSFHYNFHQIIHIKRNFLTNILEFLGKHSLKIYLIHQPILFGLVYTFSKFFKLGK